MASTTELFAGAAPKPGPAATARPWLSLARPSVESCGREDMCSALVSSESASQDSLDTRGCASSSWLNSPSARPGSCSTLATTCCGGGADGGLECLEEIDQDDACCESLAPQAACLPLATIRYLPGPVDKEIVRNELRREGECSPSRSPSVNRDVRSRAMAWLVDVTNEMKLTSCTLHLASAFFDKFLASTTVVPPGGLLQLLALACASLASKQYESQQRFAHDWLALALSPDGLPLFMREDLLKMEWLVVETLEWRTQVPTTHSFLQHLIPALAGLPTLPPGDDERRQRMALFASYLSELSLLDDRFLDFPYSTNAAACLVLGEYLALGSAPHFRVATHEVLAPLLPALDSDQLKSCVAYLHDLHQQAVAGATPVTFAVARRFF